MTLAFPTTANLDGNDDDVSIMTLPNQGLAISSARIPDRPAPGRLRSSSLKRAWRVVRGGPR